MCEDWMVDRKSTNPIGRRHMQKPRAYSSINPIDRDSFLSTWELPIVALVGVVMLFMISFALANPSSGHDDASGHLALAGEFSTGMPLP
jgi:hypothetical protein